MFDPATIQIMGQILLATVLGFVIGFERSYKRKAAGIRTHALVAMGSALFTALSINGFGESLGTDPSRVAAQVVVGIGFIGAGIIFLRGGEVRGLTTAAGVWAVAAIGMAVGLAFYDIAVYTTLLTLVLLWGVRMFERKIPRKVHDEGEADDE